MTTIVGPSPDEVIMMAFAPDGESLVYSQRGATSTLIDLKTKKTVSWNTESSVFAGAFTADAKTIAMGMFNGDIVLYDVASGTMRFARGHSAFPSRIVAHPTDPDLLLSCADEGSVRVWHVGLAREIMAMEPFGPRQPIRNLGWDNEGERIFVAGPNGDLLTYRMEDVDRAISASEESERTRLAELRTREAAQGTVRPSEK
jgi:WD40 repeat protein